MNETWIYKATVDELTRQLVSYDSVSSRSNEPISDFVAELMQRMGFVVENHTYLDDEGEKKVSLVAKRGSGTGGVAYLAHTDVVPVDDWHTGFSGPFEAVEKEGRLYGRGACDMKGSLAAALKAVSTISEINQKKPIYFVVTADEEISMGGAKQVNRESAFFQEMVDQDVVGVVGEPTELRVVHAHKGAKGLVLRARGISAHTSTGEGKNANDQLIPALLPLLELKKESEREARYRNDAFSPSTLSWNMVIINEPLAVNVTTSLAEVCVFFRTMPGVNHQPLVEALHRIANEYGLELEEKGEVAPWSVDPTSPWIVRMGEIVAKDRSETVCFATDGGVLQRLRKLMICGPGSIDQAHRNNEWISMEQLHRGVSVYEQAFRQWTHG
jgi:acetylornithine deacetylase